MTEEELRKEATSTIEWENVPMIDRPLFVHGYITGAKPREKQIQEKDKQLTKAKEHIRTLISCLIDYIVPIDKDYCYITEAKQFLKEE